MKKFLASLMVAVTLAVGIIPAAEAKYRGSSSSFSSTRVYRAPSYSAPRAPVYRAPSVPAYRAPTTTYRSNTTVINQRPAGGGFFSNMLSTGAGVLGGMALFEWLKPDPKPAQQITTCPEGMTCTPAAPVQK